MSQDLRIPRGRRSALPRGLRALAAGLMAAAALMLAACGGRPPPAHFIAAGRPEKLSDWSMVYARDGRLALNTGVLPYDLNTPLFTDYAHKLRTVWMPPGRAAKYDATGTFDFPVGTVITKTFFYPKAAGTADAAAVARTYEVSGDFADHRSAAGGLDLARVRLIETRVLVRREQGWEALPYVWNEAQSDAALARTGDVLPLALVATDGARQDFSYVVPDENQCASCHVANLTTKAIAPIGPKARHLNRDYVYADGPSNQLARWTAVGYLTGAPDSQAAPRNADWRDPSQPLTARARAYLDINCGHCHNPAGPANTTALDLSISAVMDRHLGLCKPPVAAGAGTGNHLFDIVPGKPDESILPFRMASTQPGVMMPEQGRSTLHTEGLALIRDWIAGWTGDCS